MAASKRYVAVAPVIIVHTDDGRRRAHVYEGQVVPSSATAQDVERLLGMKFIAEAPAVEPDEVPVDLKGGGAPSAGGASPVTPAVTPARTVKA